MRTQFHSTQLSSASIVSMPRDPDLTLRNRRDPLAAAVDAHAAGLLAIARGIVKSDDLARDAVQETLVCLWHEREPPRDLGGWLARTVVHKSLHLARGEHRRRRREERAAGERVEGCPLCDPARVFEDAEVARALDVMIATLSCELRAIFVLRHRHGLEYAAIAAQLHVPIGTVRSRLARARRVLQSRISADRELSDDRRE